MKKKLLIIFSIIVLIIGGYFVMNEYKKKRLVNEAQEKAEEHIIESYKGIEEVNIDRESYFFDPIGGLSVGGHINNDEELYFNASFLIEKYELESVLSVVRAHDFQDRQDEEKEDESNYLMFICLRMRYRKKFLLQKSKPGVRFYEKKTVNNSFNHHPNHRRLFYIE